MSLVSVLAFTTVAAPEAGATHTAHQDIPYNDQAGDVIGACTIWGVWGTSLGIELFKSHNHHEFSWISIWCEGTDLFNELFTPNFHTGSYAIDFEVATDGPGVASGSPSDHGEDFARAWSHNADYLGSNPVCGDAYTDEGCGYIRVWRNIPNVPWRSSNSVQNYIKFTRSQTTIRAWGAVDWDQGFADPGLCFDMTLERAPWWFSSPGSQVVGTALLRAAPTDFNCG